MCKIFNIFIPTLEAQAEINQAHKNLEKKVGEINNYIEKTNRNIRGNNTDELEKIKNEASRA